MSCEGTACGYAESPQFSSKEIEEVKASTHQGVPLNTPWTFWIDKTVPNVSVAEYEANLKKIYTVFAVQEFWAVYNNIPKPSVMQTRYCYHLMRNENRPIWEEPYNQKGGTWRIKCNKRFSEMVWQELLLAAIGEQLTDVVSKEDQVLGLTISVRDGSDIIQIWNSDASLASQTDMEKWVKSLLPEVQFPAIFYKPHQTHAAYNM
uniref:Eukaryotic translation initiation factor 4E type 3-B n=1 Tax=Cacopsylla melanoneura TaxID=428564 RepID=A0A8D8L7V0_9HEMI